MADETINFEIKGFDKIKSDIDGLESSVTKLKSSINLNNGAKSLDALKTSAEGANKSSSTLSKGIDGLKSSLSQVPGAVGGAAKGFDGLTSAAKAFIMNPIGAVIAGLVAVFAIFKKALESTEKGTFALKEITAGFAGIVKPLIKIVGELAAILGEGLAAGMKLIIDLGEKLGLGFATSAKEGMALAKTLNEIEEAEGDLEVARAKQNQALAEARDILTDTNKTYAQRKTALDEIKKSETELAQKEVDLAKKRLAAAKEKARQDGESTENLDAIDKATIKLAETETELANKRRIFNREQKKLDAETEADRKAKEAEAAAAQKARQEAADAYAKRRKEVVTEIATYEQKLVLQSITDETEKQLKILQFSHDRAIAEINNGNYTAAEKKKLTDLENKYYLNSINETNKKKAAADEIAAKATAKAVQDEIDKNVDAKKKGDKKEIDNWYKNQLLIIKESGLTKEQMNKEILNLDMERLDEELKLAEKYGEDTIDLEIKIAEKRKEIRDKESEDKKKKKEEEKELVIKEANAALDVLKQGADLTLAISDAVYANKLKNVEKGSAEETAILKKQFEDNKKIQIAQTIISGLNGVVNALAAKSLLPDPFGAIQKGINAAFIAGTTIATVSKISSQQFPASSSSPEGGKSGGGKGSMYANGGMLQGPSHQFGGIKTAMGELEGGEFVINKRSTSAFLPLLQALNDQGRTDKTMSSSSSTETPIFKTYVVASEMSSQQEANKRVNDLAKL